MKKLSFLVGLLPRGFDGGYAREWNGVAFFHPRPVRSLGVEVLHDADVRNRLHSTCVRYVAYRGASQRSVSRIQVRMFLWCMGIYIV